MRLSLLRPVIAAAAIAISGVVIAQQLPSALHLTVTQRSAFLVLHKDVVEKLELTTKQVGAIDKIVKAHNKSQLKLLAAKSPSDKDLIQLDKAFSAQVLQALQPEQQKDLLKVALKELGVYALADEDISKRLKLTANQSSQIGQLLAKMKETESGYSEMVAKGFEHFMPAKTKEDQEQQAKDKAAVLKSYQAERAKIDETQNATRAKILALLNETQRAQWMALTGA